LAVRCTLTWQDRFKIISVFDCYLKELSIEKKQVDTYFETYHTPTPSKKFTSTIEGPLKQMKTTGEKQAQSPKIEN